MKKFPILPSHPERICWGCDQYCAANALRCGNGSERTPHPAELFGDDWFDWQNGGPADTTPGQPTTGADTGQDD
ncbi:DUF3079 domain-containing protein [Crenobacter sp. SG2303]|uniref:DUF3079 domain-containing protein n=1 Tax=Crenobacter oryzisoli TaxID=3056844 RepID=A0ABT7XLC8_9NEIS|nr:DUF3079 domain-containing protein [Crenobacter sp. SG2303]MDN0074555.1 DUF3079 domain-containing protein [Crenobacter sp. SG2303]